VLAAEAADADRDPVRLPAQGVPERVPDGGVHLARDLRDREAVCDRQVEVDDEPAIHPDAQPGVPEAGPFQQPADGSAAGEARHAVHGQRGRAHEVTDGTGGDKGASRDVSGHAGVVLLAGAGRLRQAAAGTGGVAGGLCYDTTPLAPDLF
jgi:hypothetical protein